MSISFAALKAQVSNGNYDAFRQYLNSNPTQLPPTQIGGNTYTFRSAAGLCSDDIQLPPNATGFFVSKDLDKFSHAFLNTSVDLLGLLGADLKAYQANHNKQYQAFLNHLSNNQNLRGIIFANVVDDNYATLTKITKNNKNIVIVSVGLLPTSSKGFVLNEKNIASVISALGPQVKALTIQQPAFTDTVLLNAANGLKQKGNLTDLGMRSTQITSDGIIQFSNLINEANLTKTPINLINIEIDSTHHISDEAKNALTKALSKVKQRLRDQKTARFRALEINKILDNSKNFLSTQSHLSTASNNADNIQDASVVNHKTMNALKLAMDKAYETSKTKLNVEKTAGNGKEEIDEEENTNTCAELNELDYLLYRGEDNKRHPYCSPFILRQITKFAYGDLTLSETDRLDTHEKVKAVVAHHSKQSNESSTNKIEDMQLSPFFPFEAETFQYELRKQQQAASIATALDSTLPKPTTSKAR